MSEIEEILEAQHKYFYTGETKEARLSHCHAKAAGRSSNQA